MVLAAFAIDRRAGLQPIEVLFAAYYFPYLLGWFALRWFVYGETIVRDARDAVLLLFPVYVTASLVLTAVNGGKLGDAQADWLVFTMLGFYFPARELYERHAKGPTLLAGTFLFLGGVSLVRNLFALREAVTSAEYAWQVARVRVTSNEILLFAAAILCLAYIAKFRNGKMWIGSSVGFAVFAGGVVISQWRSYYIALAIGVLFVVLFAGRGGRGKVIGAGVVSAALSAILAYLIIGDGVMLLAFGLLDRVLSIGTATSADISLINRFAESSAAWDYIWQSPIVGHGIGVSFSFYDLIFDATWTKTFVHNGYLHLWFKFGIIGLTAFVYAWGRSIWDGWIALRRSRSPHHAAIGLCAAATLVALAPTATVAAPFTTTDVLLCFALLMALASGSRQFAATSL